MGWPITAYPQDMIAMQELTLKLKPFHINETGIPYCESNMYQVLLLAKNGGNGIILGIDFDSRMHNQQLIVEHSMF